MIHIDLRQCLAPSEPIILDGPPEMHRIPGDFLRNAKGQPKIKGRLYWRFSNWPFDDYTGIDMIYAHRGTWVHSLTEWLDSAESIAPDGFRAEGVALGISDELQDRITSDYLTFRATHGLTAVHVEAKAIASDYETAGTIDRIDRWPDGSLRVADIKTSGEIDRAAYAVQLVYAVDSKPIDPDTEVIGEWDGDVRTDVAYIYWYPLTKAIKGEDVAWTLVEVTL